MSSLQLLDTIIQTLSNNDHDTLYDSYPTSTDLSMDRLSLFIQNKQLLDQFDDKQLQFVQYHIVNRVFGGFRSLLNMLLEKLTISTHQKLYIELNHAKEHVNMQQSTEPKKINIHNSTNNSNTRRIIDILPENVMSYTMRYLTSKERCYTQNVCRFFAIAARQELSVNCINEQFPLMGMIPYQKRIIKYFSSDDPTENLTAINLCLKYRSKFPIVGPKSLLQRILQFEEKFCEQVESVIIEHSSKESIDLFCSEYRNLKQYYSGIKSRIISEMKMSMLIEKMQGKCRKLHSHCLQSVNEDETLDIINNFKKMVVRETKGDGHDEKEAWEWLEEYSCDKIGIIVYTRWVQEKFNDCQSDYELDKLCREKIIPQYIQAVIAKENGFRTLVHTLSRYELKEVHKLIKEVSYSQAKALNNAFLNRDKT